MQTHAVLCSLIINCASDEIVVNYQLRDWVFFFLVGFASILSVIGFLCGYCAF